MSNLTATASAAAPGKGRRVPPHRADQRRRELAEIHLAAKALRLDEDAYRDLMSTVCGGIRSAAQLDQAGRLRWLEHLRTCLRGHRPPASTPARKVIRGELTPMQRQLWSLWMRLVDAGLARERSMGALQAWVERQTGVTSLTWLTSAQERQVAEAMKLWLRRAPQAAAAAKEA